MSTDPQPANKMQYLNQLELNDKSSLLDDLRKNTMYIDNIKQVKSNDFTPGEPHYCKTIDCSIKKNNQKVLKDSIKFVAEKLHNTEAVCKSNYLDPELISLFSIDVNNFKELFYKNNKINRDDIYKYYVDFLENI